RSVQRISQECAKGAVKVIDHSRATKRRVLEIVRAAKSFTDAAREQVKSSYSKLMGIARSVVNQAETVMSGVKEGTVAVVGKATRVVVESAKLAHFLPLVENVLQQTKARVFEGNTHFKGKLVSIFEEHSQVICKGKAHKAAEFGRLVRVDEVENGIVSNYHVCDGNASDEDQWVPALSEHKKIFGHAPKLATADRGFSSAANERAAEELGVKKVVLPRRGRLSEARKKLQGQRWFKRAMKWRGNIEARIATLKHRCDMVRAHYKGDTGFKRYTGWSVIANNLTQIARARAQRKAQNHAQEAKRPA
ncbi:MAG: transposase, partial [Myxococcales bacterium]|nr:transposase [Myxococcales bacterium]